MNISNRLETAANVSTTLAALLIAGVLTRTYLFPSRPHDQPRVPTAVSVGSRLNPGLDGVDWAKNGRTLILAISTQCHFCRDSEPFYRRLRQELGGSVKIIAVMPQGLTESQDYLDKVGLHVDQIKQVTLSTFGVRGTPTIILVDKNATVTNVWVGKLEPAEQDQVLSVVRGNTTRKG